MTSYHQLGHNDTSFNWLFNAYAQGTQPTNICLNDLSGVGKDANNFRYTLLTREPRGGYSLAVFQWCGHIAAFTPTQERSIRWFRLAYRRCGEEQVVNMWSRSRWYTDLMTSWFGHFKGGGGRRVLSNIHMLTAQEDGFVLLFGRELRGTELYFIPVIYAPYQFPVPSCQNRRGKIKKRGGS
jgi:hypothetical protein